MTWLRTVSWPRAAAMAAGWVLAAIAAAIAAAVAIVWFAPAGDGSIATAKGIAVAILLCSPIAAGLVHRTLRVPALALACFGTLAAVGVAGLLLLTGQQQVSAATSPDGSWSVAVIGKRRLNGAYELVVEVRDAHGQVAPGGAYVVGITRDLAAAERTYAVSFVDNTTAMVGSRTLDKARFIRE